MNRGKFFKGKLVSLFTICLLWYAQSYAGDSGLIGLLSSQLGVTEGQAEGGAGSIFQAARQNLSIEDFSKVAGAVPGIDRMLGAAPKLEGSSGTLGGLSSMVGGSSGKLGGMAALTGSFEKLGLSGDMVGKFTPVILDYVKTQGGEYVMDLLKGALPF
ncbi:MAG: DUF2780 domain-containing protein [Deltaproteobacteria bacterium]|nr:DUF2780 domain-containing protein [Deltaproteobacteria bacterium]